VQLSSATPSGWDINDVRFSYDATSDTAYFGEWVPNAGLQRQHGKLCAGSCPPLPSHAHTHARAHTSPSPYQSVQEYELGLGVGVAV
jgi:hypothetical protein